MSNPILWRNLFRQKKAESLLDVLRNVPIFEDLSRSELKSIERILHRRSYRRGEYIFREGETGLGMYIVEEGAVAITVGEPGHEKEISLLRNGEFFGEMALLHEDPRSANAVARVDTIVLGFFQPDLLQLLETNPRLGVSVVMRLARIIAERLQHLLHENKQLQERIDELERNR
ncbi:MAG: cyclic nucleotide-binding domain-containing protein [Chlorobi bacterium]|nr:cyclic nucleotide-binding domain-containing protein [Chlorobiota bacterium]